VTRVAGSAPGHPVGGHRARLASLFDEEVRPHNERFRAAAAVGPRDRVLDVGCGTGESTREAARAAAAGRVVGVDVAEPVLAVARQRTAREGLRNVCYLRADAQTWLFAPETFDLCLSRFGVMFFADPIAAFTNIGRALRPGGRLVLLVWQARDRNEWSTAVRGAILGDRQDAPAASAPPGADPFSLGDPAATTAVLERSGFAGVGFTDVHEPVYYGPDVEAAAEFVLGLREPAGLLAGMDAPAAERARRRLRALLAAHHDGRGVYFDSRAWIITARRG
jgi:SAM-dependent methyltransferase